MVYVGPDCKFTHILDFGNRVSDKIKYCPIYSLEEGPGSDWVWDLSRHRASLKILMAKERSQFKPGMGPLSEYLLLNIYIYIVAC
jgi:hypothetical protein